MEYQQPNAEPEDPPEIIQSAAHIFRHRNPLHHVEVRYDLGHMFRELRWADQLTSSEYWDLNDNEYAEAEDKHAEEYEATEVYDPLAANEETEEEDDSEESGEAAVVNAVEEELRETLEDLLVQGNNEEAEEKGDEG